MIRELHNLFCGHVSDADLTVLVTGELSARREERVARHLAGCKACRTRRNHLEDVFSLAAAYHAERARAESLNDRARRANLAAQLYQMPDSVPTIAKLRAERGGNRVGTLLPMSPILVTGLLLAAASITCVFVWMQQSRPAITSNALLVRAEVWDPVGLHGSAPGVIRQTVKITTPNRSLRRTIYRDLQGRRKPKEQKLAYDEDLLKQRLAEAEVFWDAPLSARSYQEWHDAQRVRQDRIRLSAGGLLVLTTTTPNGAVAAQSLTVRDTDFHPVRRTVSFRDSGTVDIAELDYSVMPWTPSVGSLFQPEQELAINNPIRPHPEVIPIPPPPLSDEQLNDAELSARLTLNRLHADTGEQIEVTRGPRGVEVHGITDTEERKHELEAELDILPHVTSSISSIEELKAKPSQPSRLSSVKVIEMQTQTTPLETWYLAHGRSVASVGDLAQRLFNAAFAINLESSAIDDLQHRFSHDGDISLLGSATLADLLFTHKRQLLAALEDEEQLLADAQIEAPRSGQAASTDDTSVALTDLAQRNLALTKELALSKGANGRSAETIAAELAASMDELSLRARAIQVAPQTSTKLDGRK